MNKIILTILLLVTMASAQKLPSNVTVSGSQVVGGNLNLQNGMEQQEYTNCSGGTTVNLLAKLVDNAGTACIQTATNSDTNGVVGVVVSGAGTSGTAQVARAGQATCIADNTVADTDYLVLGSSTGGRCKSATSTYPTSGQVIGRATSGGNAGASITFNVYSPGIQASTGGSGGALNTITSPSGDTSWLIPNANKITITTGTASSTVDTLTLVEGASNTGTGALLRLNGNTSSGAMTPFQIDAIGLNASFTVDKNGGVKNQSNDAATPSMIVKGQPSASTDIFRVTNSANTLLFSVSPVSGGFIDMSGIPILLSTNALELRGGSTLQLHSISAGIQIAPSTTTNTVVLQHGSDVTNPTSTATVVLSPTLQWKTVFWNGVAASDIWGLQDVVPTGSITPTSTLTLTHSGSTGALSLDLTAASTTNLAAVVLQSPAVGTPSLIVKGQASPSADMFRITDSSNSALFVVNQFGQIDISGASIITSSNGLILRGAGAFLRAASTNVELQAGSGNVILDQNVSDRPDPTTNATVVLNPTLAFQSRYWNGTVAASDTWGLQNVLATGSNTPTSILTLTHSGTSGATTLDLSVAGTVKLPNAAAYTVLDNNTGSSATPSFHTMSPLVKTVGTGSPLASTNTSFVDIFNPTTISIPAGTLQVGDTIEVNFDVDSYGGTGGTPTGQKLGLILNATAELSTTSSAATTGVHTIEHVTVHLSVQSTTVIDELLIRYDSNNNSYRPANVQTTVSDISSNALVLHPGGYFIGSTGTGQTITGIGCRVVIYHGSNF